MTTRLHNLTKRAAKRKKIRLGRGNATGKGTYAARGLKGQRARAGGKGGLRKRSLMRQFIKKTPKLGGFKSPYKNITITLAQLNTYFEDGETVNLETLRLKKLVTKKVNRVKIVNKGKLIKKLKIDDKIALTQTVAKLLKNESK